MSALFLGPGSANAAFDNLQGPVAVGPKNLLTGALIPGPVRINGIHAVNEGDDQVFLQLFNVATTSAVVLGTTVPQDVVMVPGATEDDLGLRRSVGWTAEDYGINAPNYSNGLVVAATMSRNGNDLANFGDVFANFKTTAIGI